MAVTVTTWAELLTACAGSEAIVWGGASRLESVTLTVASECTNKGTIAVNAPSIDFNGLTIGTISTTGTRNFHDDNLAQHIEAWERGFCAVYSDSVFDIYNLTVEHIALENPRDILCQGLREMRNVYCYDIYAPSVEHTSKWLRDSGRTQDQTQYRTFSEVQQVRPMSGRWGSALPTLAFLKCVLKMQVLLLLTDGMRIVSLILTIHFRGMNPKKAITGSICAFSHRVHRLLRLSTAQ